MQDTVAYLNTKLAKAGKVIEAVRNFSLRVDLNTSAYVEGVNLYKALLDYDKEDKDDKKTKNSSGSRF